MLNDDVLRPSLGALPSYEFHWTDHLNAVLAAGCTLFEVKEFGEDVAGWEGAPNGRARRCTASRDPC